MAFIKKYDLKGKEIGEIAVDDAFFASPTHPQLVKDYLVHLRNNQRQWSACAKTRAEVNRTGKKPHAQKGTGKARQGATSAPQYRGGGTVHGPRPKSDQNVRMNRKERRAAIRTLLGEKIQEQKVFVLQISALKEPETKKFAHFLETVAPTHRRTIFLAAPSGETPKEIEQNEMFRKSIRNIPQTAVVLAAQINGYDLAVSDRIVILEDAVDEVLSMMGQG